MAAIQEGGWAAKLFSSALFCLWLSIASVSVWFDAAPTNKAMPAPMTVQDEAQRRPSTPAATTPVTASAAEQGASRATPATGKQPDAA